MGLKITPLGQTIVKPTALGPVANTDTKLLIYVYFKRAEFWHRRGIGLDRPAETQFGASWPVYFKRAEFWHRRGIGLDRPAETQFGASWPVPLYRGS